MTQDEMSSALPINPEALQLETYLQTLRDQISLAERKKIESAETLRQAEKIQSDFDVLVSDFNSKQRSVDNLESVKKTLELSVSDLHTMLGDIKQSIEVAKFEIDSIVAKKNEKYGEYTEILRLVDNAQKQYISVHKELEEKMLSIKNHEKELTARISEVDKIIEEKKSEILLLDKSIGDRVEIIEKQDKTISEKNKEIADANKMVDDKKVELIAAHKAFEDSCKKTLDESNAELEKIKKETDAALAEKSKTLVEKQEAESGRDAALVEKEKAVQEKEAARKFVEDQENTINIIKRNALLEIARTAKQNNVKIDKQLIDGLISE